MMRWIFWLLAFGVVSFALWVRLAPDDPARWHVDLEFEKDEDDPTGARRIWQGDRDSFGRLHDFIVATPRTRQMAGDPARGHVSYVTRSALWGFPDYTTVQQVGGTIRIWSRLRFGRGDLGVNRARIETWRERLTVQ